MDQYNLSDVRLISLSEEHLYPVSMLREKLNISGMTTIQANLFRNKIEMKKKLDSKNINVPNFLDLSKFLNKNLGNEKLYYYIESQLGSPFVLKPKDSFGSQDVDIIYDIKQFNEIVGKTEKIYNFEVETYISGKLYHIDTIYNNGNPVFQVCSEYSTQNLNFRKSKPLLSIPLPNTSQEFILGGKLSNEVIKEFNYLTGATHLEFFIQDNGNVVFLEIGARTPGGIVIPMYNKNFNTNISNMDLLNHFDIKYNYKKSNDYYFSGTMPIIEGTVTELKSPELGGSYDIEYCVKKGEYLGKCKGLRDIAAKIIVKNKDFKSAYNDFKSLDSFVAVNVF